MKNLKFAVLLATLISVGGGKSYAHDIAVANADGVTIYYNFTNNQTELEVTYQGSDSWYADYAGNVVIPESVTYEGNTYSVTSIGRNAFTECRGLTEVTIPNSVTSIGSYAFVNGNGLEKIAVESSNPNFDSREDCNAIIETNSNELIVGCKKTIIPNSVASIGSSAFYNCNGLTEVTIPNSVTSIGRSAFAFCNGLTEVTIPNSVTSIGDLAFALCSGLIEVTIGNSVTSIGEWAFSDCSSLTTLYSLNTTPPTAMSGNSSTFDSSHYTNVDVFVPQEALAVYQSAEVWQEFKKLQGFEYSSVKGVDTKAEQIQSANGQITVTGLTDGTTVAVYDLSGKQVGTATSKGGQVSISTGMTAGAAAIVKVGERSVKTVMK